MFGHPVSSPNSRFKFYFSFVPLRIILGNLRTYVRETVDNSHNEQGRCSTECKIYTVARVPHPVAKFRLDHSEIPSRSGPHGSHDKSADVRCGKSRVTSQCPYLHSEPKHSRSGSGVADGNILRKTIPPWWTAYNGGLRYEKGCYVRIPWTVKAGAKLSKME